MSGRITLPPIGTAPATVADYRPRGMPDERRLDASADKAEEPPATDPPPTAPAASAPVPSPPQHGTGFTAALVAEAVQATPTPSEIYLRGGKSWAPPISDLHLTDRIA